MLRCFHALGVCYQHSGAVSAGTCSLLDDGAYFRVQEFILSSDSMRGACHGSVPTWHMIRNYCNYSRQSNDYHLIRPFISLAAFFISNRVSGQKIIFVIKLKHSSCFFWESVRHCLE